MVEETELDLAYDQRRQDSSVHRWWARRQAGTSLAVLLLTNNPEASRETSHLQRAAADPSAVTDPILEGRTVLDLCSGAGTVAAAARRLGARVTAVDNHPIPVLTGRATLRYPIRFGAPNPTTAGVAAGSTWGGLAVELGHWSQELVDRAKGRTADLWMDDLAGLLCSQVFRCPACLHEGPASLPAVGDEEGFAVERGVARCPVCGESGSAIDLGERRYVARGAIPLAPPNEPVPLSDHPYDAIAYPPNVVTQLDDVWAIGARPIAVQNAITPRQAYLLRAMQGAFRSIRDELADLGYAPEHASSVLTLLALGTSDVVVDLLSTYARWDNRRRVARGVARAEWSWPPVVFVEVGGPILASRLKRRFQAIAQIVDSNAHGSMVDVRSDDMRSLRLPDSTFDLVIWDPPYYDNIDYDRVALPYTRFLRSLIGELHADLQWPETNVDALPRPRLEVESYEEGLRRAADAIARVLRPGGQLGVFWTTVDEVSAERIRGFVEVVQPQGLELIKSVALQTEVSPQRSTAGRPHPRSMFLVFRRTQGAQPADTRTVLEGALAGRSMMYSGLTDLLIKSLDEDDIAALVPNDHKGPTHKRLAEVVMNSADPHRLLDDVPKQALRTFVKERTGTGDTAGLTKRALEDRVFRLLGWKLPGEPDFTVGSALDELQSLTSQLRLGTTETDIRGRATAAFDRIEQVLRFSITTWATFLRGDDWASVVEEVVERRDQLTFGQWLQAFRELPHRCATESPLIGQIGARVRRSKVIPDLDRVVALRNSIAHPAEQVLDWSALRTDTHDALQRAVERLRAADEGGALPQVLRPVEETRDSYGRYKLRLIGHGGRHVEFLMTQPSDLTNPVVVLRGDTNPREVDPVWVSAELVAVRAGLDPRVTEGLFSGGRLPTSSGGLGARWQ